MMRADRGRSRAEVFILAGAVLLAAAAASRAQDEDAGLKHACANEIGLFCPGESGAALFDCLSAYRGSATAGCRALLKGVDADAPAAKVWASSAAWGGAAAGAPGAAAGLVAPGFDFTAKEEPRVEPVLGARPQQLIDRMAAAGLEEPQDERSTLSFTYASKTRDARCSVSAAHVQVRVLRVDPEWSEAKAAPAALAEGWRRFQAALRLHEDGHKDIAVESGQEFLRRLKTLGSRPNCTELDAAVRGLYARERLDARRQDADYDARTARGRTQWEKLASGGTSGKP
ncbi:MAG: DUF922 domain-containing protein [Elusimicrobia bacterium]|nr:DUF922 domain-containing protein [Elusimicrobiota bacterium]